MVAWISNSCYYKDERDAVARISEEGPRVLLSLPQEQWVAFFEEHRPAFQQFFSAEEGKMIGRIGQAIKANPSAASATAIEQAANARPRISVVHFALQHAKDTDTCSRQTVIHGLIGIEEPARIGPLECDVAQSLEELQTLLKKSSNPFFSEEHPKFLRYFKTLPTTLLNPAFREAFSQSAFKTWLKPLLLQIAFKPNAMEVLFPLLEQADIPALWSTWRQHHPADVGEWIDTLEAQGLQVFPEMEGPPEYELEHWLADLESKAASFDEQTHSFDEHFGFFIGALGHHPRLNDATFEGWTMLHVAACQGHLYEAKVLLEAGANPLMENQFGLRAKDLMAQHKQMTKVLKQAAPSEETYQALVLMLEQAEMQWVLPPAARPIGKRHL